ncbi:hypothetical protein ACFFMN_34165 [Planobispora siamensis]|uniref:MmpS family membrane protein n=1 Tax=Planobispora siamensis TaxID=936338 RepID=A0A8J3SG78_9ACTN|nr:hypothetical protein [Planobispora siamensis]GIH91900.1 hypothetical protein Psi01_25300 [Planobispora siamensis]
MRRAALALTALLAAAACSSPVAGPAVPSSAPPVDDGVRTVVYRVTGSAPTASLTVQSATGTEQDTAATLPIELAYEVPAGGFVAVSAQNNDSSGDVTCSISVDGTVISENSGVGGYAIASCSGTAD